MSKMNDCFFQKISDNGIEIKQNAALSDYTSFKIGGKADYAVMPKNETELAFLLKALQGHNVDYFVLGNGSNVLASDNGYKGAIILTSSICGIEINNDVIRCRSGEKLSRLCVFACENSLSGLEFAYGIPGSVGGGIYMNAGAYGGEISDVIISASAMDKNGNIFKFTKDDLEFGYRKSVFCSNEMVIISADFQLKRGDKAEIKAQMDGFLFRRKDKQPLEFPSAGSTFKRPVGGYASALIDECGLKGKAVGGARVSEKHAGFIINAGNASCNDVLTLIEEIKAEVLAKKGIELECEICMLGS